LTLRGTGLRKQEGVRRLSKPIPGPGLPCLVGFFCRWGGGKEHKESITGMNDLLSLSQPQKPKQNSEPHHPNEFSNIPVDYKHSLECPSDQQEDHYVPS